jgi:hypothetical protein
VRFYQDEKEIRDFKKLKMVKFLTILQNIDYFDKDNEEINGDFKAMYFYLNEILKLFP